MTDGRAERAEEHLFLARDGNVLRMEVEASRHSAEDRPGYVLLLAKPCQRRRRNGPDGADQGLRFLSLLETIPGLLVRFDRNRRVSYASRHLERQLNVAPGALAGNGLERDAWAWIRPLREAVVSVFATGEPQEVMLEATLADEQFTETMHVLALRDARGEIEGTLAYAETSAEWLLREATIHSTDGPLREIFQAVPDGLFLLEAGDDGRFLVLDVNPAFAHFSGRSRGELTGRYLDEIMPSEHVRSHTAKFRRCMETGERIEEQGRLVAATGPLWYGSILMPVRDHEGRIRTIAGIFRDIAEKMHMKMALQESERRYREIVERSTDSIYLLEATPDRRFRAVAANQAFEATFGIRREDAIGRLLEEIVPRPLAELLNARYAAVLENGNARDDEWEVETPGGRHRVHSTVVPMQDAAGGAPRIMVIARTLPLCGDTEDGSARPSQGVPAAGDSPAATAEGDVCVHGCGRQHVRVTPLPAATQTPKTCS